ncbi:alpha/beta hydrolase [Ohtaekwangia kribbensis]|jgi:phospholipase/carboxylesterase|uniref:Alpha/beta hydrolase n=1 Tax=Ohtaekwangia kribbensis TaxID=688913 RepID=A0ABW3K594_9BACT
MHTKEYITAGKDLKQAKKALIMLHGRGAQASDILSLAPHLQVSDYALVAPQATNYTWYPYSFMANPNHNEPWLSSALDVVGEVVKDIEAAGIPKENIYFLGFSQGACLTLEYVTRNATKWGGVVAFTGGLIGDVLYTEKYKGDFAGTPVFIGTSDPDPHVPVRRVQDSTRILQGLHANVTEKVYPNMGHTVSQGEIDQANKLVFKS